MANDVPPNCQDRKPLCLLNFHIFCLRWVLSRQIQCLFFHRHLLAAHCQFGILHNTRAGDSHMNTQRALFVSFALASTLLTINLGNAIASPGENSWKRLSDEPSRSQLFEDYAKQT